MTRPCDECGGQPACVYTHTHTAQCARSLARRVACVSRPLFENAAGRGRCGARGASRRPGVSVSPYSPLNHSPWSDCYASLHVQRTTYAGKREYARWPSISARYYSSDPPPPHVHKLSYSVNSFIDKSVPTRNVLVSQSEGLQVTFKSTFIDKWELSAWVLTNVIWMTLMNFYRREFRIWDT